MRDDFNYFNKWAKSTLNIDLESYKEKQLQRRILSVMNSSGAQNLKEYAKLIENDDEIKKVFLDYITINVTEFYRNKEIFYEFEQEILNRLVPKYKTVKIWSAACSIGAEPYSIAIIFERNKLIQREKIIATDIDDNILKRAQAGVFNEHEVKNVKQSELNKYFTKEDNNYYIKSNIKNKVTFKKHDLLLDKYESGFHAIVCRNVTIYFKNEAKDIIYKKISEALVSGGIFFTGATESIYNPERFGFNKVSTFLYEKI